MNTQPTVDEVLSEPGLTIDVAKSMLAAVVTGRSADVSDYLWMRLLNTYIALAEAAVDQGIADFIAARAGNEEQ